MTDKKKKKWFKVRPFEKWKHDADFLQDLPKELSQWYREFMDEYISNDFRSGIMEDEEFITKKLNNIKATPERYGDFVKNLTKENKKRVIKNLEELTEEDFMLKLIKRKSYTATYKAREDIYFQRAIRTEGQQYHDGEGDSYLSNEGKGFDEDNKSSNYEKKFNDYTQSSFSSFEQGFLNSIKADQVQFFINENLLYCAELLYIDTKDSIYLEILDELEDHFEMHINNLIELNMHRLERATSQDICLKTIQEDIDLLYEYKRKDDFDRTITKHKYQVYQVMTTFTMLQTDPENAEVKDILERVYIIFKNYLYNKKYLSKLL